MTAASASILLIEDLNGAPTTAKRMSFVHKIASTRYINLAIHSFALDYEK